MNSPSHLSRRAGHFDALCLRLPTSAPPFPPQTREGVFHENNCVALATARNHPGFVCRYLYVCVYSGTGGEGREGGACSFSPSRAWATFRGKQLELCISWRSFADSIDENTLFREHKWLVSRGVPPPTSPTETEMAKKTQFQMCNPPSLPRRSRHRLWLKL